MTVHVQSASVYSFGQVLHLPKTNKCRISEQIPKGRYVVLVLIINANRSCKQNWKFSHANTFAAGKKNLCISKVHVAFWSRNRDPCAPHNVAAKEYACEMFFYSEYVLKVRKFDVWFPVSVAPTQIQVAKICPLTSPWSPLNPLSLSWYFIFWLRVVEAFQLCFISDNNDGHMNICMRFGGI